jgi:hypothetical protein
MHPTGIASIPQHDVANVLIACVPFGLDDLVESLPTPFVLHETKKQFAVYDYTPHLWATSPVLDPTRDNLTAASDFVITANKNAYLVYNVFIVSK